MNKTCPFCGKKDAFIDTIDCSGARPPKFRVQCRECKVATAWYDTEEAAWKAWNTRDTRGVNMMINKDAFILNNLFYSRNQFTNNCTP